MVIGTEAVEQADRVVDLLLALGRQGVDELVDGSLKSPKRSQHRRHVPVDNATLDVLSCQADQMADRAAPIAVPLAPRASCLTLASTSAWWHNAKGTDHRC